MLSLEQEGGDPMKGYLSEFYDKDQMSSIWPEAYMDWVQDWQDTMNKERGSLRGLPWWRAFGEATPLAHRAPVRDIEKLQGSWKGEYSERKRFLRG
jgi:hypothetical protein